LLKNTPFSLRPFETLRVVVRKIEPREPQSLPEFIEGANGRVVEIIEDFPFY